ncbi:MAG: MerR family transcriptional regulator [Leptospiraceae bacterium]|nr:MerR family transcriptional regulator [Leptospiraceae bacterium]
MKFYSVKETSELAGVSIRTLHYYEEIGLLKPKIRTDSNYRYYTETELLRLQQILIFKELGFPLKEISKIIDSKNFDLLESLINQKAELEIKFNSIHKSIGSINKTIQYLKEGKNMKHDELYVGLPKEFGEELREESIQNWGQEVVKKSEDYLASLSKKDFEELKIEFQKIWNNLFTLKSEDPESKTLQNEIKKFYIVIGKFWGISDKKENYLDTFKGLGELYISDERHTTMNGNSSPEFAKFLKQALSKFETE